MLVEDERRPAGLAETAIGETDAVGLDELRWRGLVIVRGHWNFPLALALKPRCEAVESGRRSDDPSAAAAAPLLILLA
jgi:hypothetical protein